jgi:hypothetical protein
MIRLIFQLTDHPVVVTERLVAIFAIDGSVAAALETANP